jgi:hypothetical protein
MLFQRKTLVPIPTTGRLASSKGQLLTCDWRQACKAPASYPYRGKYAASSEAWSWWGPYAVIGPQWESVDVDSGWLGIRTSSQLMVLTSPAVQSFRLIVFKTRSFGCACNCMRLQAHQQDSGTRSPYPPALARASAKTKCLHTFRICEAESCPARILSHKRVRESQSLVLAD